MTEHIEEREVYFIFHAYLLVRDQIENSKSEVLQYQALFEKLQVVTGR
jgi:hypothetical protein